MRRDLSGIHAVLLFATLCFSAEAADLGLVESAKNFRSSSDPIEVTLGDAIPEDSWQYLHLEIDAIDVTEFISVADGKLSYTPQEPLQLGTHQVRLVAVLPDGNIEELANWSIETRTSQMFVESTIESNLDVQVSQRIADNLPDDSISKTQGQGSYVFASNQATPDWRLTSNADFIYNSQEDQTQNGKKLDLNEFSIKSEWSQGAVVVGHQTPPVNSLVLTDFNRRGVSGSYHNKSNSVEVAGFAARTETITGFRDGLGVGKDDRRTSGIYARVNPMLKSPEKLILTGVVIRGQGVTEGAAELGDDVTSAEGDARALIVESYIDKKRVYLRGEVAKSHFDFDGSSVGFDPESDKARSAFAEYSTERDENRAEDYNWSVGFLHQRIGRWFYSLGNASLPADKQTGQVLSNYANEHWQINASVAREESNVDNDPLVPVIETRLFTANVTYTPFANSEKPQSGIFSNPTYTFSLNRNQNEQTTSPTGFLGDPVDMENSEMSFILAFSGDGWNWSLTHTRSNQEDKTNVTSDMDNKITSLEAGVPINENFGLTPVVQTSTSKDKDNDITVDTFNAGITLQYSNNDDLSASLGYTVSSEEASDGSNDTKSRTLELLSNWIQRQASDNKFGLSYFARANRQDMEILNESQDNYQVFLGVNLTWPATF